jgi:hypothetical protein
MTMADQTLKQLRSELLAKPGSKAYEEQTPEFAATRALITAKPEVRRMLECKACPLAEVGRMLECNACPPTGSRESNACPPTTFLT